MPGLRNILIAALIAVTGAALAAQRDPAERPVERAVAVPLHDGRVRVDELATALLESYGLDANALSLPERSIDVSGLRGHLKLLACRKLLLDTVRFERAEAELVVTVDRERARAVRRELRGRVARLFGDDVLERRYALDPPADDDAAEPLVVLVHGIESDVDVWDDLRAFLASASRPPRVATFAYPNDGSCEDAAAALAAALRALGDREVRIVAHSMGGLVARAALEDPDLDPGNVTTLVMIGTPNGGSNLAALRLALEAAHLLRPDADDDLAFGRALLAGLRANLSDGLGEAGGDLLPGSVFLTKLDRRPRNPAVDYHLVLGTRGVLDRARLDRLRAPLVELARDARTRVIAPRLDAWLADLDEIVDGRGDGAVAVARGRLDGVEAELVRLDHVGLVRWDGLLGRTARGAPHPVFERVRAWVAAPREAR